MENKSFLYIFLAFFAMALTSEAQVARVSKYLPSMDAASFGEYGGHSIPVTLDYLGGGG